MLVSGRTGWRCRNTVITIEPPGRNTLLPGKRLYKPPSNMSKARVLGSQPEEGDFMWQQASAMLNIVGYYFRPWGRIAGYCIWRVARIAWAAHSFHQFSGCLLCQSSFAMTRRGDIIMRTVVCPRPHVLNYYARGIFSLRCGDLARNEEAIG